MKSSTILGFAMLAALLAAAPGKRYLAAVAEAEVDAAAISAAGIAATQAAMTRGTEAASTPSGEPGTTTVIMPTPTIAAMAALPLSTTTMPMAATIAEARLGPRPRPWRRAPPWRRATRSERRW